MTESNDPSNGSYSILHAATPTSRTTPTAASAAPQNTRSSQSPADHPANCRLQSVSSIGKESVVKARMLSVVEQYWMKVAEKPRLLLACRAE